MSSLLFIYIYIITIVTMRVFAFLGISIVYTKWGNFILVERARTETATVKRRTISKAANVPLSKSNRI